MAGTTKRATYATIRWMKRTDLYRVLDIEFDSYPDPWTEDELLTLLRMSESVALVAMADDVLAGFIVYSLKMRQSIEILNIAVAPEFRRQRIGTQLVDKLQRKLCWGKRSSLRLNVRETNVAAQCFLRENGFVCVETLHGEYEGTDEAALRFVFALDVE